LSIDLIFLKNYNVSVMALHKEYPNLYYQIHRWARINIKKPGFCGRCNKTKKLELSNNSGDYKLTKTDWEWICRSCHARKDGWNSKAAPYSKERMEKIWAGRRGRPPWNKGMKMSDKYKKKLSKAHLGQVAWNKGIPMSKEAKAKLSRSLKGKIPWNKGISHAKLNP